MIEIEQEFTEHIQKVYDGNVTYVKKSKKLSEPLYPTKGLRQSCSISPLLLNVYLERVLKKCKGSYRGLGITVNDNLVFKFCG